MEVALIREHTVCSVNGVQLVVAALTCGGSLNRVIDVFICRVGK